MQLLSRKTLAFFLAASLSAVAAQAGPIFLTGHDPDFHTQAGAGATLFETGLNYAMNGLLNDNVHKLLWVESSGPATSGHLLGADSLGLIGLTAGVDYDVVNAVAFLAMSDFSGYQAIGVASTFGGMLTSAELNALITRKADIAAFINAGGGLFASAECDTGFSNCDASNLAAPHGALFGFLPVAVSAIGEDEPFTVTAFGASLGLTNGDVNDPTHNSFGAIGGLNVVDTGATGIPTTLAGVVKVDDGGFTPVPEPATLSLLGMGLAVSIRRLRRASR